MGVDRAPEHTVDTLGKAEAALARRDRDWPGGLAALLDEAFLEVGVSGRSWSRGEVEALLAVDRSEPLELHDLVVERLTDDVALVRFVTEDPGPTRRRARRVSVWVRRDGTWRLRYHQGTVAADGEVAS